MLLYPGEGPGAPGVTRKACGDCCPSTDGDKGNRGQRPGVPEGWGNQGGINDVKQGRSHHEGDLCVPGG